MLFYNQVKKEFSPVSWKFGQVFFREERVKSVKLKGNHVDAKIKDTDDEMYSSQIIIARGTVLNSSCSCTEHRKQERHCKHIAALSVWVIERGSLLRAGVGSSDDGIDEEEQEAAQEEAELEKRRQQLEAFGDLKTPLKKGPEKIYTAAEPVVLVRAQFQGKMLQAITAEVAVRFTHPKTLVRNIEPLLHLIRDVDAETAKASAKSTEPNRYFKTLDDVFLKLTTTVLPILNSVDAAKIVYPGASALENLAKLLSSEFQTRIEFHKTCTVTLDEEPLKLITLSIGSKSDAFRQIRYEFKNSSLEIGSDELEELSKIGRLSPYYVWKGEKLYKFETSLAALARYANRSGVSAPENNPRTMYRPDGYSTLEDGEQNPLHPLAAFRLSLELGVSNFIVDADWKEFHDWKANFEKKRLPKIPTVDFGFDLREYQVNGLTWLWTLYQRGLSALLADDMGLGKTHQVLALLCAVYKTKAKPKNPTLVIAPTSVVAAWAQKLARYETGLNFYVFHGKTRSLPEKNIDLVLTTYGILQKEEVLRQRDWHMVVLDEAQAIKNASTISSRASRALKCQFRIAMTGTPVENQSTDLWSVMEFLLPGYLGSLPRFKRIYGSGRDMPSRFQSEALKRLVSPFLLRRTKSQVLKELPEKTEEIINCPMTAEQKKMYRGLLESAEADRVRKNLTEPGNKVDYASILALLTRLKQVCDHPKLVEITSGKRKVAKVDPIESGKWEVFEELVNQALGSNLKIVVFTQYLGMIDLIGHQLAARGIGYTELRGDTPDRGKRMERFSSDPDCRVFLCSLLAGGLGIDLTAGSVCIHYDRWWNPAKENQATDRLHRIGQTRGVQVFKLQTPNTIEDRIASIIEAKKVLSNALVEESPTGLKAFSRNELLALFSDAFQDNPEE